MMESANPIPRPAPSVNLDDGGDVVTTLPAPMVVQESTVRIGRTPRHYARRVFIPDDLAESRPGRHDVPPNCPHPRDAAWADGLP